MWEEFEFCFNYLTILLLRRRLLQLILLQIQRHLQIFFPKLIRHRTIPTKTILLILLPLFDTRACEKSAEDGFCAGGLLAVVAYIFFEFDRDRALDLISHC